MDFNKEYVKIKYTYISKETITLLIAFVERKRPFWRIGALKFLRSNRFYSRDDNEDKLIKYLRS